MLRGKERFLTQIYMLTDFLSIQAAFFIAWFIRFESLFKIRGDILSFETYLLWSMVYGFIAIFLGFTLGLYMPKRKKSFAFEIAKVLQIQVFTMIVLLSILFITKTIDVSRYLLMFHLLLSMFFIIAYRFIIKVNLRNIRKKGYNKQFILIVGAGSLGKTFCKDIMKHPEYGFDVFGFLDDFITNYDLEYQDHKPIIGNTSDISSVLERELIDEVVVALPLTAHKKYKELIDICEKNGVRVTIIPDFYDILPAKPHFDRLGDVPIINIRDVPLDEIRNKLLKRGFDIIFSILMILLTSPLMILIAIGIKLTSPGPIIFKQQRIGLNRRKFKMYKFRSMNNISESISDTTWSTYEENRKTKFGLFLRKTSLDELPQFFNVILGDMSVVGPRPERPYFVDQFKEEIPKYMIKHHVRPGLTGWAQVCGYRGNTSIKQRIIHDIFYIENWTWLFDLKIICKTVISGFINKNA